MTYIIAEMAYSHDGSFELAERIVRGAAEARADAISIHITDMPNYMVPHYGAGPGRVSAGKEDRPIYDYLDEISLPFDDWAKIIATAREVGLDPIIMPNDLPSLNFARTLAPEAFVISAACFEEHEFIQEVGRAGLPIYLRVGGATLGEIETVIDLLKRVDNDDIVLLYGHQNYPTKVEDTNLLFLRCLESTFGLPVGIADHVDADDELATILPLLALPLGISCIEKHLTHDRSKRGEDFESALNPEEFGLLVERVRKAERSLGSQFVAGLDDSSIAYRSVSRKRLVAARDIQAGERLADDAIIAKRSDEGASPAERKAFVGQVARRNIPMHSGIDFSVFGDAE